MGKTKEQEGFEAFRDELNDEAPFVLTSRGLGLTNTAEEPDVDEQGLSVLIAQIGDRLKTALSTHGKGADSLDLKAILSADIRALLKPLFVSQERGSISMLDVVTLGLTEEWQIRRFLKLHGVDLDQPKDIEYADVLLKEAIGFFDEMIAADQSDKKVNPILRKTRTVEGICKIFQAAAGKDQRQVVPQACAILRIAAAIDFLNRDPLLASLPLAEAELQKIAKTHFHPSDGKLFFKTSAPGEPPLELVSSELRTKTRQRMISKLLHKPENKADEVVDHVGMRITTKSAFDALRFLYAAFYKPNTSIFPGMTIYVRESKQLLLDSAKLMEALQDPKKAKELVKELAQPTIDHADLTPIGEESNERNRFSSKSYRAIHVTFDLPIIRKDGQRGQFPVELQVVDAESRKKNESRASHTDYINRQMDGVRARVTGNNLLTEFQKSKDQS